VSFAKLKDSMLIRDRNDAPNGLWINTLNIKGCQVQEGYTATDAGLAPVNYTSGGNLGAKTFRINADCLQIVHTESTRSSRPPNKP
jgi:hypothetical protein